MDTDEFLANVKVYEKEDSKLVKIFKAVCFIVIAFILPVLLLMIFIYIACMITPFAILVVVVLPIFLILYWNAIGAEDE